MYGEDALVHENAGPDPIEQFVLGDEASGPPDERDQYVIGLGCKMHVTRPVHQTPLRDVEAKISEAVQFQCLSPAWRVHHSSPLATSRSADPLRLHWLMKRGSETN